jgi:Tfp pilus assembly PilM family ATPase
VLSLLHQGAVVYGRVLADGGVAHLHAALARRLGLDGEVIDYLLGEVGLADDGNAGGDEDGGGGSDAPDDARALLAGYADGVARELQVSFSYATHQYPDAAVAKLLLVGGGAALPGLPARLSATLGVEAAAVAPTALAACEPSLLELCSSPALTTALGLALFPEL